MILGWKFEAGREMRNLTGPKMQPHLPAFALTLPEACGRGGTHSQTYFEDPNLPL